MLTARIRHLLSLSLRRFCVIFQSILLVESSVGFEKKKHSTGRVRASRAPFAQPSAAARPREWRAIVLMNLCSPAGIGPLSGCCHWSPDEKQITALLSKNF